MLNKMLARKERSIMRRMIEVTRLRLITTIWILSLTLIGFPPDIIACNIKTLNSFTHGSCPNCTVGGAGAYCPGISGSSVDGAYYTCVDGTPGKCLCFTNGTAYMTPYTCEINYSVGAVVACAAGFAGCAAACAAPPWAACVACLVGVGASCVYTCAIIESCDLTAGTPYAVTTYTTAGGAC